MLGEFSVVDFLGLIVFLLAAGYVLANRRTLPDGWRNPFLLAFFAFGGQILAANAEQVMVPAFFNLMEHFLRTVSAVFLAAGCWGLARGEEGRA